MRSPAAARSLGRRSADSLGVCVSPVRIIRPSLAPAGERSLNMNGQENGKWRRALPVSAAAAVLASGIQASAGVVWNEASNGDLSDLTDYSLASAAARGAISDVGTLTAEVSTIIGRSARTTANAQTTVDGDSLLFTVPAGMRASVLAFTHDLPLGVREFLRVEDGGGGPTFILPRAYPPVVLPGGGQNLLAQFGVSDGLGAGSYVLSFENGATSTSAMGYGIDIVIEPVPTPGAGAAAVCAGLAGAALKRRRRG